MRKIVLGSLVIVSLLIGGLSHTVQALTSAEAEAIISVLELPADKAVIIRGLVSVNSDNSSAVKCFQFTRNLGVGSAGNDVRQLHTVLDNEGFAKITLGVPNLNVFDEATAAAIVKFQAKHSISPQSGFVGPLTRAKLNQLCNIGGNDSTKLNVEYNAGNYGEGFVKVSIKGTPNQSVSYWQLSILCKDFMAVLGGKPNMDQNLCGQTFTYNKNSYFTILEDNLILTSGVKNTHTSTNQVTFQLKGYNSQDQIIGQDEKTIQVRGVIPTTVNSTSVSMTISPSSYTKSVALGTQMATQFVVDKMNGFSNASGFSWKVIRGSLPPGLTPVVRGAFLGTIEGTPTAVGTYSAKLRASYTNPSVYEDVTVNLTIYDPNETATTGSVSAYAGGFCHFIHADIAEGAVGNDVVALHKMMQEAGYGRDGVSGTAYPETYTSSLAERIKKFQLSAGITATGKVDQATRIAFRTRFGCPTTANRITVLSPEGRSFNTGSEVTFQWVTYGVSGVKKIYLSPESAGRTEVYALNQTANDFPIVGNSYKWKVPSTVQPGSYTIGVVVGNGSVYDLTDKPINIVSPSPSVSGSVSAVEGDSQTASTIQILQKYFEIFEALSR